MGLISHLGQVSAAHCGTLSVAFVSITHLSVSIPGNETPVFRSSLLSSRAALAIRYNPYSCWDEIFCLTMLIPRTLPCSLDRPRGKAALSSVWQCCRCANWCHFLTVKLKAMTRKTRKRTEGGKEKAGSRDYPLVYVSADTLPFTKGIYLFIKQAFYGKNDNCEMLFSTNFSLFTDQAKTDTSSCIAALPLDEKAFPLSLSKNQKQVYKWDQHCRQRFHLNMNEVNI